MGGEDIRIVNINKKFACEGQGRTASREACRVLRKALFLTGKLLFHRIVVMSK